MEKTLLVFANSVKHHDHCVAGKCIETKQWIRPVSSREGGALSQRQVCYENGQESIPLEIVKMKFSEACPLLHQPENLLITEEKWELQSSEEDDIDFDDYLDIPNDIWGTGKFVSHTDIEEGSINITQSLYLLKVSGVRLTVETYEGRKKRRATFRYKSHYYDLPVTDPIFDSYYDRGEALENNILCISLGENFEGRHYKIIAGIY